MHDSYQSSRGGRQDAATKPQHKSNRYQTSGTSTYEMEKRSLGASVFVNLLLLRNGLLLLRILFRSTWHLCLGKSCREYVEKNLSLAPAQGALHKLFNDTVIRSNITHTVRGYVSPGREMQGYALSIGDDSMIILSASLIARCPRKQIEAVIAHECAHIKLHHHTKKGMFHNAVDCIRILSTPKIGSHVNLKEVADFWNSASAITACGELAGNQLQQHHEFQADKFSALVVDPISLIRFFQDFESTGDRALSFRWVWRRCRNPFTLLISECAADNMVTLPFYGFIKALDIVDAVTMIRLVFQCTEYSHYLILSAWRLSPLWISIVGHTLKSLFQPGRKVDLVSEFANDLSKSHPSMPRRISQLEKLKTFHISRTDVAVASIIFITLVAACSQYK